MDVQDLYARALDAIDDRRWAEAKDLLVQVQHAEAGYGDSERFLEMADRLAQAEDEIAERRVASEKPTPPEENAPVDKVGGPAWVGLALFLGVIGVVVTLFNLLMQSGR